MRNDYEERKVDKTEIKNGLVSTAAVSDGIRPFETAVMHEEFNGGDWIVVEAYDTREDAHAGHKRWVETLTAEELPEELTDCCNSGIANFARAVIGRSHKREHSRGA